MLIKCTQCDKEFHKSPSQIKASKNHFCEKECHHIWRREQGKLSRTDKVCDFCEKEFSVINSKADHTRFCSRKCRLKGYKVKYIELECEYCNKKFTRNKTRTSEISFCDRECSEKWNSEFNNNQVLIKCLICDREFNVQNNRAKTAKSCSKDCHYKWLSEHYAKSEEGLEHYRNNGITTLLNKKYSETRPERIMSEFLIHNHISFIPQHLMYDKFVVDFYLPESNMVIEVFGDYWHGSPDFYGESEGLKPLSKQQIKQKGKDRAREAYLKKCGHEFIILWEDDIYNKLQKITKFLLN